MVMSTGTPTGTETEVMVWELGLQGRENGLEES